MQFKLWGLNLIIMALVLVAGGRAFNGWTQETLLPVVEKEGLKSVLPSGELFVRNASPEAKKKYEIVAVKDLFSPARQEYIPPRKMKPVLQKNIKPAPKVVPLKPLKSIHLQGIVITEEYRAALLSNPTRGPGVPKNVLVHEGDFIGGMKLSRVGEDRVILVRGPQKYELLLYDPAKPRSNVPNSVRQHLSALMISSEERQPADGRETKESVKQKKRSEKKSEVSDTDEDETAQKERLDNPFKKRKALESETGEDVNVTTRNKKGAETVKTPFGDIDVSVQ